MAYWETHRLFLPYLGVLYGWLINSFNILAVGVIIVCVIFLIKRNVLKLQLFASNNLNGWPRSDANYVLITEIVLMYLFLIMYAMHPELAPANALPPARFGAKDVTDLS